MIWGLGLFSSDDAFEKLRHISDAPYFVFLSTESISGGVYQ